MPVIPGTKEAEASLGKKLARPHLNKKLGVMVHHIIPA
jgi:hypothetical protein